MACETETGSAGGQSYFAVFLPDRESGQFVILFPDLPDAVSAGLNLENAMEMAQDVLNLVVGDRVRCGEPLPHPCTQAEALAFARREMAENADCYRDAEPRVIAFTARV